MDCWSYLQRQQIVPFELSNLTQFRQARFDQMHTLYVGNDNDFVPDVAGLNRWYVFGFTDDYLASLKPVLHSSGDRGCPWRREL